MSKNTYGKRYPGSGTVNPFYGGGPRIARVQKVSVGTKLSSTFPSYGPEEPKVFELLIPTTKLEVIFGPTDTEKEEFAAETERTRHLPCQRCGKTGSTTRHWPVIPDDGVVRYHCQTCVDLTTDCLAELCFAVHLGQGRRCICGDHNDVAADMLRASEFRKELFAA